MVFDASTKPNPLANSVNECMYTGPPLQPLLLADLKKAFLQIGIKEEHHDAFGFRFSISGREEHLRFARIPSGAEASPFMLGATLQHHFNQQSLAYEETIESPEKNT